MAITHEAITSRSNIYNIDPMAIKIREGWNKRVNYGDIDSLEEAIKKNVKSFPLPPLIVKKVGDDFVLINGHRRLKAIAQLIKKGYPVPSVPCVVTDKNISDIEAKFLSLASDSGKPLEPIEEAEEFNELKNWGVKVSEIALRFAKSEPYIYRRILLVNASPELKEEIRTNNINLTKAEKIIKESSGKIDNQNARTRKARKSNRLSVKEIKALYETKKEVAEESGVEYWKGYAAALENVLDRNTME